MIRRKKMQCVNTPYDLEPGAWIIHRDFYAARAVTVAMTMAVTTAENMEVKQNGDFHLMCWWSFYRVALQLSTHTFTEWLNETSTKLSTFLWALLVSPCYLLPPCIQTCRVWHVNPSPFTSVRIVDAEDTCIFDNIWEF